MTPLFAPKPLQFTARHGSHCELPNYVHPALRLGAAAEADLCSFALPESEGLLTSTHLDIN